MTPGRQYLINRVAELEHMTSTLLDQKGDAEAKLAAEKKRADEAEAKLAAKRSVKRSSGPG